MRSIRQLNYCLAALGAAASKGRRTSAGMPMRSLDCSIPPCRPSTPGVRGYYFAAAAAAWLFGPWAFMGATVVVVALLFWRQVSGDKPGPWPW
jgi:uncharacterized membrane protein